MKRSCNAFEPLDFKKADWPGLCSSIKLVNWQVRLHDCIASDCLSVIIETLSDLCSIHVPPKCYKNKYVSRYHRVRKILMRKRTKLKKISPLSLSVQSKLVSIDRDLLSSHQKDKMSEESLAVTRIKSDSKYFFQIC